MLGRRRLKCEALEGRCLLAFQVIDEAPLSLLANRLNSAVGSAVQAEHDTPTGLALTGTAPSAIWGTAGTSENFLTNSLARSVTSHTLPNSPTSPSHTPTSASSGILPGQHDSITQPRDATPIECCHLTATPISATNIQIWLRPQVILTLVPVNPTVSNLLVSVRYPGQGSYAGQVSYLAPSGYGQTSNSLGSDSPLTQSNASSVGLTNSASVTKVEVPLLHGGEELAVHHIAPSIAARPGTSSPGADRLAAPSNLDAWGGSAGNALSSLATLGRATREGVRAWFVDLIHHETTGSTYGGFIDMTDVRDGQSSFRASDAEGPGLVRENSHDLQSWWNESDGNRPAYASDRPATRSASNTPGAARAGKRPVESAGAEQNLWLAVELPEIVLEDAATAAAIPFAPPAETTSGAQNASTSDDHDLAGGYGGWIGFDHQDAQAATADRVLATVDATGARSAQSSAVVQSVEGRPTIGQARAFEIDAGDVWSESWTDESDLTDRVEEATSARATQDQPTSDPTPRAASVGLPLGILGVLLGLQPVRRRLSRATAAWNLLPSRLRTKNVGNRQLPRSRRSTH